MSFLPVIDQNISVVFFPEIEITQQQKTRTGSGVLVVS
jgi:hypothetical protein